MRAKFNVFVFVSGLFTALAVSALPPIHAYPIDQEGNLLVNVKLANRCQAKAEVTNFVYKHRHEIAEEQMLADLHGDWDNYYSTTDYLPWSSFVDMQRIVRDAYRKDADGDFIRDCCEEEIAEGHANKEYQLCLHYTQY